MVVETGQSLSPACVSTSEMQSHHPPPILENLKIRYARDDGSIAFTTVPLFIESVRVSPVSSHVEHHSCGSQEADYAMAAKSEIW